MTTFFDLVTVASFVGLIGVFLWWTERDTRTLLHFVLSGVVLAVANQTGNAGHFTLALVLVFAGVAYAAIVVLRPGS